MPTYHYACSSCSNEFDQYQTFAEDALTVCPSCQGFIRRVIQPVGVVFKGTGWYLTDSRKSEKSDNGAAAPEDTSADSSAHKADPKAAETDATKSDTAAKKTEAALAGKSVESKPAPTTAS